MRFKPI